MIEPIVITANTVEPVTLAEVQEHCRIDTTTSAQDDLIEDIFIPAARDYVEYRTGRTIHQKTLEWLPESFPFSTQPILLYGATPLISVTSIKYKDSDGTETTWGSSNYIADTDSTPGRVRTAYGIQWPSFTPYPVHPIRIRGAAGIATTSPPTEARADIKHACLLLIAKMWEYREAVMVQDRTGIAELSVSYGIEAFLSRLQVSYAF